MLDASHLPDDIDALKAMLLAREAALQASEARVAHLSAELSTRTAEIEHLKLVLAKLKRMQFGRRSEKLDLLDELIGTVLAEEGAVLIFTQYVAMARLLEAHLGKQGVPHQFLHGGTPVREREAMVAAFQAGEVPVFLLSLMGIPPLVGFMGKLYVFAAIIEKGPSYWWLAAVGAINAAIAAYYYARVLKTMIIDAGNEEKPVFRLATADQAWVAALALANVLPLLFWSRIEDWARASLTLYAGR